MEIFYGILMVILAIIIINFPIAIFGVPLFLLLKPLWDKLGQGISGDD